MIERVLNRLGLYTKGQYFELVEMLVTSGNCIKHYSNALEASEEAKANAIKENEELKKEIEKLRLKVARSVKRRVR